LDDQQALERVSRIETLLSEVESLKDPQARATAIEALQGILELYGEGLTRIMAKVTRSGHEEIVQAFADDELVAHLLLLHDLHPVTVEARIQQALQEVRPYLQSHGGNVEFLGVEQGIAHLRLQGSCHGCPSSTQTLKTAIEEAIQKAAPELLGIEAEGTVAPAPPVANFIPISTLHLSESAHGKSTHGKSAPEPQPAIG